MDKPALDPAARYTPLTDDPRFAAYADGGLHPAKRKAGPPRLSDPNPCVRLFGAGATGQTCRGCAHLRTTPETAGTYWKCDLRANTRGPGTDHKVGWPACARYEAAVAPDLDPIIVPE